MDSIKKVVLAYSGGLDTSIIIPWLKENYNNCEVIAVAADVGQGKELSGLQEKAIKTGASKLYIEDLRDVFVNDFIFPTLKAGAVFELAIKAFAPNMKIIAPWRTWELKSREEEIAYAEARNIPLNITRETNYSKDKNLWHLSHEGLDLEDPANEPKYDEILEMGVSPEKAPDKATYITLSFEKGIPVALDGVKMDGVSLIEKLNALGGANGIGLVDMVENRLVGMKSRGVYETPGGSILYKAHDALETLCLDRDTQHYKQQMVAGKFSELVYYGQWFTPLREALSAFVDSTQETVTGDVKLKLYKGNMILASITSPYSLYDEDIATFSEDEVYNQMDSQGFINLFGLPIKVKAMKEGK